jgi:hypothetical protein
VVPIEGEQEIILDKPFRQGVSENVSGTAQASQNGGQPIQVPWSYTASPRGTLKVTVPAGTFRTTKWNVVFRLGQLEAQFAVYAVGLTDVRLESKQYLSGSLAATISRDLMTGPVR